MSAGVCPLCGSSDLDIHPADDDLLVCRGCAESLDHSEPVQVHTPQTATQYIVRNGLVPLSDYSKYLEADDEWCPGGYELGNGGHHQVSNGSCDLCGAKNFS
ncbi:Uncharacterised protein (plasmid) [Tsukamurella tyrosinosolvens]|uniref:Uncharacterized protein n=1 Tax=Tsukamurella tyrosinosolvens TaxID=57704 RepID=A0A1H4VDR9_TSUTY|nr:hypothetical protein [Tsukamurella tyrosinosolvens]KXO91002.1 hypothetical protein AXK58_21465 [Tsukamurella tyrosinosolvens]SEC79106.1 hypothetical protein SAMN04489793_3200 [Tsukamurella tyrosinosolvens]VEH90574.1 Uncharacterised protein [Tsukamurella tyrosinosolvens]